MRQSRLHTYVRLMPFDFTCFGANAVYYAFFTVHLNNLGLGAGQIGAVMALAPLASLLGRPLWGAVGPDAAA